MAYVVNDMVDVKLGTVWHPAVVKEVIPTSGPGNDLYAVDLDNPLPTLAECGKTHPRVPGSTPHGRRVRVNCTGNQFIAPTDLSTIRDRV